MSKTSPTRILVVDDDPSFAKMLDKMLQGEGYVVVIANGGLAGIDAFQAMLKDKAPFDLVITDLGMHEVDGRKVSAAVKLASPSTPVILLTGWGQWFEAEAGLPLSVDCVLGKPLTLQELRKALSRFLK